MNLPPPTFHPNAVSLHRHCITLAFIKVGRVSPLAAALTVIVLFLCASVVNAQVPNTNTFSDAEVDSGSYFGWPTDPIADTFTVTNYFGGYTNILTIGAGPNFISASNWNTHASFTLHQNGHLSILDQYGSAWDTHTNGQLVISNWDGTVTTFSNGLFSVTKNGAVAGSLLASNATFAALAQPAGIYFPTNGTFSLFAVTNPMVSRGITNFFWTGPSNRSYVSLDYNAGTMTWSNLFYNP